MPHFLALAWMYREDYARGDLKMLPVVLQLGFSCSEFIHLVFKVLLISDELFIVFIQGV